ncbi:hypothetical protein ACIOJE_35220 [Kitasatospora sp. NPDC087861]|uniref:hypothetical protein n=1 Tax=Kitasatospora sp. NPDC087861 TaxID=3364070 RepID=UPI0038253D05
MTSAHGPQAPHLPAVPGGIVLRATRTDTDGQMCTLAECPPAPAAYQALRSMQRTALAYSALMTARSRVNAELWAGNTEEAYAALCSLSNSPEYSRSWTLRNGHILTLTLTVAPSDAADAPPTGTAGPEQHGEAPPR